MSRYTYILIERLWDTEMTFPAVLDILISPTGYSDLHEWQKRSCVCVSCVCVICGWKSAYCGVCKVVLVHDEPDQYFYISHQHLTGSCHILVVSKGQDSGPGRASEKQHSKLVS